MASIPKFDLYKTALCEQLQSANNVKQLIPILQTISFDNLKQYIQQQINTLNVESCKYSYFHSCDIGIIVGEDIMQYILSFAGNYNTKGVNKKWKTYANKNEQKQIVSIHESINNNKPSQFEYDKNKTKVWIVHKNRKELHSKEIELNYQKPTNSLHNAIANCDSGDTILIYDGIYELRSNSPGFGVKYEIDEDIMMVGFGNNVTITRPSNGKVEIWSYSKHLYIENITFESIGIVNEVFCSLWMNHVKITAQWRDIGLYNSGGDLFCTECDFVKSRVRGSYSGNVNIQRCRFKKCGRDGGCIEVTHGRVLRKNIFLKCIGNVFEDIGGYPICQRTDNQSFVLDEERYELTQNVLKGVNAQEVVDVNDANKLYSI